MINAEAAETSRAEVAEKSRESLNAISGQIVDAAMRVHTALGPGLLESAYEVCLTHELRKRGLKVETQAPHFLLHTMGFVLIWDTGWISWLTMRSSSNSRRSRRFCRFTKPRYSLT